MRAITTAPTQQQQGGPEPQQPGLAPDLRLVQHELAVACDQELLHVVVRLALPHQRQHFAAQVVRDLRVGIGQRLVLAHHAAQFGDEGVEAAFLGVVGELRRSDIGADLGGDRAGDQGNGERHEQRDEKHHPTIAVIPAKAGIQ